MPWYEPALRAPPTPPRHHGQHGNDNDGPQWNDYEGHGGSGGCGAIRSRYNNAVLDPFDYIDQEWSYPSDKYHSSDNHFERDCLQDRVEHQLAQMFPVADFGPSSHYDSAQNNFLPRQSRGGSSDASEGGGKGKGDKRKSSRNQKEHPNNLKREEDENDDEDDPNKLVVSKTAHFFHPRPVKALMPYKNFFSPLQFRTNDGVEELAADIKSSGNCDHQQVRTQQNMLHNDSGKENTNGVHLSQQNEFYGQAHHHNNNEEIGQLQTPAVQTVQPVQGNRPTSKLKPKNLFEFDNFAAKSCNDPSKLPPKQAKLVRDSKTGQLKATSNSSQTTSRPIHQQVVNNNWKHYGGRIVADAGRNDDRIRKEEEGKGKKKREKKKNTKKKGSKRQSNQDEGDMDDFLNKGKKRPSNDSTEIDAGDATKRKSDATKSKKQKRDRSLPNSGTELEIPTYDVGDTVKQPETNATPTLSEKDFAGIEEMGLENAAQCMEGLQQFLTAVGRQKYVAFSMLFLDPYTGHYTTATPSDDGGGKKGRKKKAARSGKFAQKDGRECLECTSSFLPTTKKYCTPKGDACTAWNCTCDQKLRAMRGRAALLGAMFVFRGSVENKDDDAAAATSTEGKGRGDGEWKCYLLPLGPTHDQEIDYARMSSWPVIPFHCDVSLADRWKAFEALLLNQSTKLVTYNATVSLLPYYHHLANDITNQKDSNLESSKFALCLAGVSLDAQSESDLPKLSNDGYLRSVWDLLLVSWMLRAHATDDELEFCRIQAGFVHLAPGHQQAPSPQMPIIIQGLTEAKNNLEFIHELFPIMNQQLVDGGLSGALQYIEAPMQSILTSMECRGIGFRADRLKSREIGSRIEELKLQSRSITKDPDFLLSSPQQVSNFIYDKLGLTRPSGLVSKTKEGSSHRSTSNETLKAIKADMTSKTGSSHQIIDIILEFRGLHKLQTTYIEPYPKVCRRDETSGKRSKKAPARIYPQWMQTTVRTGRLSCRKPNLQQIPKDGAFGVNPRNAFVAGQGSWCLFACDYSQKEVRILAHMSEDEGLISLFRGDPNVDIYKQMSSIIRNKPIDTVTDAERAQFKQVTLAILYGMSPNQVAKNLSISKTEAQHMMNAFFRRFPRLKTWMEETKANARRTLYVKTIAGRKRYLDDINSHDSAKKSQAERQAINTVIQGSAADLMKTAMIQLSKNLMQWRDDNESNGASTRPQMLLGIHDEVILEVRFKERDIKRLRKIAHKSCCKDCETLFGLKVPLLLQCSAGKSWGAMQKI